VLFALEIQTRAAYILRVTTLAAGAWITQQARNLLMDVGDRGRRFRFLSRDRDSEFSTTFDDAFSGNGRRLIKTPVPSRGRMHLPESDAKSRISGYERILAPHN
jgi:putative transposase